MGGWDGVIGLGGVVVGCEEVINAPDSTAPFRRYYYCCF